MGFIKKLFRFSGKDKKIGNKNPNVSEKNPRNEKATKLLECGGFFSALLKANRYIAKSDYVTQYKKYDSVIYSFDVLKKSGMLDDFCKKNNLEVANVKRIFEIYKNLEKLVDEHNEKYINSALIAEKDYLDEILKDVDPQISLDDDQRILML